MISSHMIYSVLFRIDFYIDAFEIVFMGILTVLVFLVLDKCQNDT